MATYDIITKHGIIKITPTGGTNDHMHVSAGSNGQGRLSFRDDTYYVSIHLGVYDGKVALYDNGIDRPYITRSGGERAPKTYEAKIVAHIVEKVEAFIALDPGVLVEAREEALTNALDRAQQKYDEAQEALTAAYKNLQDAVVAKADHQAKNKKKR